MANRSRGESSDEQRSQCGQFLGNQNGLNLATDQGNPAVFSQNLSCRMTGDQLCTGKDSGQNRANRTSNPMHDKGVERVIEAQ